MQQPPRILLIGNFLSHVIGSRSVGEELAMHLEAMGWTVLTTSRRRARTVRLMDMVLTAISRRADYDLAYVEVYSGLAFIWAEWTCRALRAARKPFVLGLHGGLLPQFASRHSLRVKNLLESAAVVAAPSPYLLESMHSHWRRMVLIPNAIDISQYRYRRRPAFEPRMVWLRAFHSIYNPSLAPKVVATLAQYFPDPSLIMLGADKGDGSLRRARELALQLHVEDYISWPGAIRKADVPAWLQKGDVFLNTANIDNAPVSIIEAMACGLAVVSTNVGGIPFLLEHQQDALLVTPNDPGAMANAVRQLLSDDGMAQDLVRHGRQKAESLDWSMILPKWEECFREVAG